jgi:hypothetical protein
MILSLVRGAEDAKEVAGLWGMSLGAPASTGSAAERAGGDQVVRTLTRRLTCFL